MPIVIRAARQREAWDLAEFHATIWRATYQGVAPKQALETLDVQHRHKAWQGYLSAANTTQHNLVATLDDQIVGFVCFGPSNNPIFGTRGEIKHLYVDPAQKRRGIGRQLLHKAFQQLARDGFEAAALAVVGSNQSAISFYQAHGGTPSGDFIDPGPIWKSSNLVIVWDTLSI